MENKFMEKEISAFPYIAGAAVTIISVGLFRYFTRPKKSESRGRSMSFSSEFLLKGSFPQRANCWEPVINSLTYLQKIPSVEVLAKKYSSLLFYDRFRSVAKISPDGSWKFYELPADFDVASIIETVECSSESDLSAKVDKIVATELDVTKEKPTWRVYRLINIGSGRSGLLFRVHHVVGDGMSLMGLVPKMFDDENGQPLDLETLGKGKNSSSKTQGKEKKKGVEYGIGFIFKLLKTFVEVQLLPMSRFDSNTKISSQNKKELKMGENLKIVYLPVIKLDFIKKLKNTGNCTVNDVLLAALAGAFRKYCIIRKDPLFFDKNQVEKEDKNIQTRFLIPVAFPRKLEEFEKPDSLRNYWVLVSTSIPIGLKNIKDRLKACIDSMNNLKNNPTAFCQMFTQNYIVKNLPLFLQRQFAFDAFSRHTMVFSNVPGPGSPVYFCGEKILGFQTFFPNLISQCIALSYDGGIYANMMVDVEVFEDPDKVPGLLIEELKEMAGSLGLTVTDDEVVMK